MPSKRSKTVLDWLSKPKQLSPERSHSTLPQIRSTDRAMEIASQFGLGAKPKIEDPLLAAHRVMKDYRPTGMKKLLAKVTAEVENEEQLESKKKELLRQKRNAEQAAHFMTQAMSPEPAGRRSSRALQLPQLGSEHDSDRPFSLSLCQQGFDRRKSSLISPLQPGKGITRHSRYLSVAHEVLLPQPSASRSVATSHASHLSAVTVTDVPQSDRHMIDNHTKILRRQAYDKMVHSLPRFSKAQGNIAPFEAQPQVPTRKQHKPLPILDFSYSKLIDIESMTVVRPRGGKAYSGEEVERARQARKQFLMEAYRKREEEEEFQRELYDFGDVVENRRMWGSSRGAMAEVQSQIRAQNESATQNLAVLSTASTQKKKKLVIVRQGEKTYVIDPNKFATWAKERDNRVSTTDRFFNEIQCELSELGVDAGAIVYAMERDQKRFAECNQYRANHVSLANNPELGLRYEPIDEKKALLVKEGWGTESKDPRKVIGTKPLDLLTFSRAMNFLLLPRAQALRVNYVSPFDTDGQLLLQFIEILDLSDCHLTEFDLGLRSCDLQKLTALKNPKRSPIIVEMDEIRKWHPGDPVRRSSAAFGRIPERGGDRNAHVLQSRQPKPSMPTVLEMFGPPPEPGSPRLYSGAHSPLTSSHKNVATSEIAQFFDVSGKVKTDFDGKTVLHDVPYGVFKRLHTLYLHGNHLKSYHEVLKWGYLCRHTLMCITWHGNEAVDKEMTKARLGAIQVFPALATINFSPVLQEEKLAAQSAS